MSFKIHTQTGCTEKEGLTALCNVHKRTDVFFATTNPRKVTCKVCRLMKKTAKKGRK